MAPPWLQFVRENRSLIGVLTIVWCGFALMEIASDWYRLGLGLGFGRLLPHMGQALFIFLPWVGLSVLVGRLNQRWPLHPLQLRQHLWHHLAAAAAIGCIHLAWVAGSRWIFWSSELSLTAFPSVWLSYMLNWFQHELLVYFAMLLLWHCWLRQTRPTEHARESCLMVTLGDQTHRLPLSEVVWLQADNNHVVIYTGQEKFRLREPFKSVLARVNDGQFIQTHRSAAVRINAIQSD